nr:reverse transcriptase domain-containing protein [Tanacetum cinerariifolium]
MNSSPSRTTNLRNEISNFQQRFDESFHEAWDRYKDLLRACPHYGFTELHQLDNFYNALNLADQDSMNDVAGGNLFERSTQDVLTIIENKSKETSAVTTAMTAILKQFQATPPPLKLLRKLVLLAEVLIRITSVLLLVATLSQNSGIISKDTFQQPHLITIRSDPRVPLILGRPFLRTAGALIDVHGEEMILRDGDERLTLNMRHDTSSYSNQPQKESINLINVFNNSNLRIRLIKKNLANLADIFVDSIPEIFTDEHALDYSSPSIFDEYDDGFLEVKSDAENVYDDPFDSKGEKIQESKLLIDELDLPCDFLPPSKYDSFISQDFSRDDA